MDPYSHRLANVLAGNAADAAALEVTIVGPELEFDDARIVAVTGALFDVTIDDRPIVPRSAAEVSAGSILRFGRKLRGARAYVAISGGINTPVAFGSRATHLPSGIGGLDGRPLRSGDRLPLGTWARPSRPPLRTHMADSSSAFSLPDGHATLRVLPGPQLDRFSPAAWDVLQSSSYRLASDSNRMGYRLAGPSLETPGKLDVISDATPVGVLQVPPRVSRSC
jgi:biotin-dependent carboxylase-like uncharacterized protein